MHLDQRQTSTLQPTQTVTVTTKLVAYTSMLNLSSLELEQRIASEKLLNPALDVEEVPQCLQCGAPLQNDRCPFCATANTSGEHDGRAEYEPSSLAGGNDDDEFDPLLHVSDSASLEETLLATMLTIVDEEDKAIAEALVGNLDERGYLAIATSELAEDLGVAHERVLAVLTILQSQEPLGIGARDLTECLMIQLRWFREQDKPQPLAEQIVAHYLKEVGNRHFIEIGRELGKTSKHIKNAWHFIRTNLNPHPANAAISNQIIEGNIRSATALVRPDVIIRRTEGSFEAEVVESKHFRLGIQSSYYRATHLADVATISGAEQKHIRDYVQRAQFFIDCVQQRWQTLRKITEALIVEQYLFLERGVRYLRPLTRNELALRLGIHDTTISRATRDKYVLLPNGRTIPFDDFFDASLRAKDTIRELIATEDESHPLSDDELAEMLTTRGIPVARRTVAKYREAMGILASRFR